MTIYFCAPRDHFKDAIQPVADNLSKDGYDVEFEDEVPPDAELAVYNGHLRQMGAINGKTTIVTFHGIDDVYDPNYFVKERWNKFDIGVLPSYISSQVWKSRSWNPRSRPSEGVYIGGWPKADDVFGDNFKQKVQNFRSKIGLLGESTVLYAPTIENDGKINDVISKADGLCDNLLIKHAPYDTVDYTELPNTTESGTNIKILDNHQDIMAVLASADVLISDQSSVQIESILVNTIPLCVADWPISRNGTKNIRMRLYQILSSRRLWMIFL